MPVHDALELTLDADPRAHDRARQRVLDHLGREPGFSASARSVYAVELVLEEWLTNAFRHGGARQVQLRAGRDGAAGLLLQFEDDGTPFDATAQVLAERPASLDEAEPGGLGLLLIQRYASRWQHSREAGRNVMRVWISAPGA